MSLQAKLDDFKADFEAECRGWRGSEVPPR